MNQSYVDYASYNIWANAKLIEDLQSLDSSMLERELQSSFSTILLTVKHIWLAEMGWLSRLKGNSWNTDLVNDFKGPARDLFTAWAKTSKEFHDYVKMASLDEVISFRFKGENLTMPSTEIVQTVLNHGSYHRGQIVTMLRQLGVEQINQTDYVLWVSIKGK